MSSPSNRIWPEVGSSSRTISRADVRVEQAGHPMVRLFRDRRQLRIDALVGVPDVRAAGVEVAARGAVDQARRATRDRHELLATGRVEAGNRLQQAPRVRVLRA